MKKFYNKLMHELLRYIHLRTPRDPNDLAFNDLYENPDKIDINEKIQIELNVFRDIGPSYVICSGAGMDIIVYEKHKPKFVSLRGWITVSEFGRVSYPDHESRYIAHLGNWIKFPSKFIQCRWNIGLILYLYEAFDKLGGQKKEMENFYYKLSMLNMSFI